MYIVCEHSETTEGERESKRRSVNVCSMDEISVGVNDNRKRCHTERLLGLLQRVCLSPPCLQGSLITLPYNYLSTKGPVKVPVK